ncbi:MAG: hypothetical protein RLZZ501_2007 [Pseudomonadota bacterium]
MRNAPAMETLFTLETRPGWLIARFPARWRLAGWSLNRPGLTTTACVAWLEVVDADLPLGVDPLDLLDRRLAAAGLQGAAGLMTARTLDRYQQAAAGSGPDRAEVLLTLGLTNGAVLDPTGRPRPVMPPPPAAVGTINLLAALAQPLSDGALLEALALAAQARTAALLAEDGRIVGTGTDCILLACPPAAAPCPFAGLHTATGQALTEAVYQATRAARRVWEAENPTTLAASRRL